MSTKPREVPAAGHHRFGRWLFCALALGMLATGVFFRAWRIDHVPGVNGDEAWMGVQALRWLDGSLTTVRTPTGNLLNVFHFGPQVALHALFPPSITLLRIPVLISGLAALVANFVLCKRVFGRPLAVMSTLVLAVLPVNIVYSRFAWDASQTVLFTLPVVYASAMIVRGPGQWRWLVCAAVALAAALFVHPTNIFLAPIPAVAALVANLKPVARSFVGIKSSNRDRFIWLLLGAVLLVVSARLWPWYGLAARRLVSPPHWIWFLSYYVDLFSGTTLFRFLAGSQEVGAETATLLYRLAAWGIFIFCGYGLWQRGAESRERQALLIGSLCSIGSFFLFAGPMAVAPGYERYAICLVAPGAILLAQGLLWWWERPAVLGRVCCLAAGCLLLIGVSTFYFRFIQSTGGRAQATFRTAAVEPKQQIAAAACGLANHHGPITLVATEWWNYWPLAYLTHGRERIRVVGAPDGDVRIGQEANPGRPVPFLDAAGVDAAGLDTLDVDGVEKPDGDVWFVEFSDSARSHVVQSRLAVRGLRVEKTFVRDASGAPLITIMRPSASTRVADSRFVSIMSPATLPQVNIARQPENISRIIKPVELTRSQRELSFQCQASDASALGLGATGTFPVENFFCDRRVE